MQQVETNPLFSKMPKPRGHFPHFIRTDLVGWLRLHEDEYGHRHYNIVCPPLFRDQPIKRAIVWPPDKGIYDEATFASFVDGVWTKLAADFHRIMREAVPVVEAILDISYQHSGDERPPAKNLLQLDRLEMIKINVTGNPVNHHVMVFPAPEIHGGHDLELSLDDRLKPVSTSFQG